MSFFLKSCYPSYGITLGQIQGQQNGVNSMGAPPWNVSPEASQLSLQGPEAPGNSLKTTVFLSQRKDPALSTLLSGSGAQVYYNSDASVALGFDDRNFSRGKKKPQ